MPIFEYKCKSCGSLTEFLELAGRPGKHICQHCGSSSLEKQFSTFSARVKAPAPLGPAKCRECPSSRTCPNATG
ncbi:MAG: zinc ribbon domain-containing protein [Planctomycetota bacterium]